MARGHIYRTVQKAQSLERVACAGCQRSVPTAQTYAAGVGLICRPCFFAIAQRRQELRAAEADPDAEEQATAPPSVPAESLVGMRASEALDGIRRALAAVHQRLFGPPS